jgi:hypothetical protein
MSDRKSERKQDQDQDQNERASHSGDLLDYDPKKARDMVDIDEAAEEANQVSSPNPDDPRHGGAPPGQDNVSEGFTTGRGMQGGSANRRKRQG